VRVSKENREEGSSRERKYSKERKGSNGGMRQKQKVAVRSKDLLELLIYICT